MARKPTFKVGDRVKVAGVPVESPMYDEGVIVSFSFSQCKVHWSTADEVYPENPAELEPLVLTARKETP